jgi:hypothetical protein
MTSTSIYTAINPTYLYIKQHSVTKKKYYGKTTKDPYTYNGSGPYWVKHINKHGKEHIVTLWVSELYYDTSIVDVALKFSADNDIVKSKEWANMKLENGLDGWVPGTKHTEETKAKQSASRKGKKHKPHKPHKPRSDKGKPGKHTEETKVKMRKPKSQSPKRKPMSEETKAKISASTKGVPKSEETKVKLRKPQSEETKAKQSASKTGKKRGPYKKSGELRKPHKPRSDKGKPHKPASEETKAKLRKPQPQIACPHCGKNGGEYAMKRWHFYNCKNHF